MGVWVAVVVGGLLIHPCLCSRTSSTSSAPSNEDGADAALLLAGLEGLRGAARAGVPRERPTFEQLELALHALLLPRRASHDDAAR